MKILRVFINEIFTDYFLPYSYCPYNYAGNNIILCRLSAANYKLAESLNPYYVMSIVSQSFFVHWLFSSYSMICM